MVACFEGVYPSAIATRAADGMPNISYLSHVAEIDDRHIAISNQFFVQTADNLRADPHATLLVVEPQSGRQYHLALTWQRSTDEGELFDKIEAQLHPSSVQIGMSEVMTLQAVDIFRVDEITPVHAEDTPGPGSDILAPTLTALATAVRQLSDIVDPARLVTELLAIVRDKLGFQYAMLLVADDRREAVIAAASIGYDRVAVGAEVPSGVGLIGGAFAAALPMRINDVSRVRRMGSAVVDTTPSDEIVTRQVHLPSLPGALSQIAIPMTVQGQAVGVLFAESRERFAFDDTATGMLEIVAQHSAALLALTERIDEDVPTLAHACNRIRREGGPVISLVYHRFDHSVFIDGSYAIKGVAGQILVHMLERYLADGQEAFNNRELRIALASVLPDYKDNLETRLLLLRRRLEELELPIRLHRVGRGRLHLHVSRAIELRSVDEPGP